jgi:hypothetical protein
MTPTFETIDEATLDTITGGSLARLGYATGYAAGWGVTSALAPFRPDLAFQQDGQRQALTTACVIRRDREPRTR